MTQWFLSYGGNQSGPFDLSEAQRQGRANPNGHAWREGLSDWQPITQISELGVSVPTPSPPPGAVGGADVIDYKIIGQEMQFVEVELDPGESAVAEAGAMMYKDAVIQMETVFGDASASSGGGFMDKLVGAGKRLLTGESLFIDLFTYRILGQGPRLLRGALSWKYSPRAPTRRRGAPDLSERQFSLCRKRGRHRDLLSAQDPDRTLRRGGLHHAEARR